MYMHDKSRFLSTQEIHKVVGIRTGALVFINNKVLLFSIMQRNTYKSVNVTVYYYNNHYPMQQNYYFINLHEHINFF